MIPDHGRYRIEFHRTVRGDEPSREFIESLDRKVRAKIYRWLEMLEVHGPDLPRPYADVLDGPIRELRIRHGRLAVRLLYFIHGRRLVIIVHGLLKKTMAVPPAELETARRARLDWLATHGSDA